MHIGKLVVSDNFVYHKSCISYIYQIRPVNSLFAPEIQQKDLVETLAKLILEVNMPGTIIVKPKSINNKKVLASYVRNYKNKGNPDLQDIAKDYLASIKEILDIAVRYKYDIFFIFSDGRDEIVNKRSLKLFPEETRNMTRVQLSTFRVVSDLMHVTMNKYVATEKVSDMKKIEDLFNYIALPNERHYDPEYWVDPKPSHLEYEFRELNSKDRRKLFTRTFSLSESKRIKANHGGGSNACINNLQLETYPTDIFVKFDLQHTKDFIKTMRANKTNIRKSNNLNRSLNSDDINDNVDKTAFAVANQATKVDEAKEHSKIRWQLFIRLRANSLDMLDKRSDSLRVKLSRNFQLSSEIGDQDLLADNLFPYRFTFKKYVQMTDVAYFAQYNFLGGLYIGEEEEDMIITYTKPGNLPIYYNLSNILEGKAKLDAPTTAFVGSTGSGKTQMADSIGLVNMIFKSMKNLVFDPKLDRMRKVEMLGDNASILIIGSEDNPDGLFDPFMIHGSDIVSALNEARNNIISLARAVEKDIKVKLYDIDQAFEDMKQEKEQKDIKQYTLTELLECLKKHDEHLAKQVLSLRIHPIGRLFMANQNSKHDEAFNLNKPYNLVGFDKVPILDDKGKLIAYNPKELDHNLFALSMSKCTDIANGFMKSLVNGEKHEKIVTFDELMVWMSIPGGEEIITNTVAQARTWLLYVFLITQQLSTIPKDVLNNLGQTFVGSMSSVDEINYILEKMQLEDNAQVKSALLDRTKTEGYTDDKKYVFLYSDYNNRKCLTKNQIPNVFKYAFDTHKKEDEEIPEDMNTEISDFSEYVSSYS